MYGPWAARELTKREKAPKCDWYFKSDGAGVSIKRGGSDQKSSPVLQTSQNCTGKGRTGCHDMDHNHVPQSEAENNKWRNR